MKIKVSIFRFNSYKKSKQKYNVYKIPYQKGMTVLDVILYVYKHLDSTLAFRYECRQGICGTCGVMLNNKPVLSCSTQIDPKIKTNIIEPLKYFPVEKDLIIDMRPILKKYLKIKPYLDRTHKVIITKEISNRSKPFRKCIECGCCIAGVPKIIRTSRNCLDPMSLVKIARFITDPRDGLNRKLIVKKYAVDQCIEDVAKTLTAICPRGIPIDEAISIVKK